MYITNPQTLNQSKLFKCNKIIAEWLQTHKIPILSISGRDYVFACTDDLKQALSKLPFYLKPLARTPECFK
jgi:hypothetical protein